MQGNIGMTLSFCTSDESFSFDELVIRLSELYHSDGFPQIMEMVIGLIQEVLVSRLCAGASIPVSCCDGGRFHLHDRRQKSVRCSLGMIQIDYWRVRCGVCGKKQSLLDGLLRLKKYQRKSNELEQIVIDAACGTSYRRAVQDLGRDHVVNIAHTTAHDWVMRSDCDEIELSTDVVGSQPVQVLADGTKFKGQATKGAASKGDLKVVIGINSLGDVFPLGSYAGTSWEEIKQHWKANKMKLPDGSIILCDGEAGLAEAFSEYVSEQQRCHWHIDRDLYHAFWQDGEKNAVSKPIRSALRGVLAIELPQADFEEVSEAEKSEIEERMEKAERSIETLIAHLRRKRFTSTATYLENAKRWMFGYVRRWLKWGIVSPRASSMVERVMREIGRRLKKIAYGWSDKGAQKIARIILKKFTNADEWKQYWKDKLALEGNVVFSLKQLEASSPNLGH